MTSLSLENYSDPKKIWIECFDDIEINDNSILEFILTHPDFSRFASLLHLAKIENILNDTSTYKTIFIVPNEYFPNDFSPYIDIMTARSIVKSCIINNEVTFDTLKNYSKSVLQTSMHGYNLTICYNKDTDIITIVNNNSHVISPNPIKTTNGIIYIIDKILP
jgi:hypothetical protein